MDKNGESSSRKDPEAIQFHVYKPRFRDFFVFYILSFLGLCGILAFFIYKAVSDYSGLNQSG